MRSLRTKFCLNNVALYASTELKPWLGTKKNALRANTSSNRKRNSPTCTQTFLQAVRRCLCHDWQGWVWEVKGEKCVVGWWQFLWVQRFWVLAASSRAYTVSDMSNGAPQASHSHLADHSSSEHVSASLWGIVIGFAAWRLGFGVVSHQALDCALLKFHHSPPAVISLTVVFCLTVYTKINSSTANGIMILTWDRSQLWVSADRILLQDEGLSDLAELKLASSECDFCCFLRW